MAVTKLTGAQIKNLTIGTDHLIDLSVTEGKIGASAVTTGKIANLAVTPDKANLAQTWDFSAGTLRCATPVTSTDVANRAFVLSVAQGLDIKGSVRAATGVPGNLATDFANGATVGDVVVATGDRILIKNQVNAVENGIYVVSASGAPTRAADMAIGSSAAGAFCFVEEGTYAENGWVCDTDTPTDVVGTNDLSFTQFSGPGTYTAGPGLTLTGNDFSVNASGGLAISGDDVIIADSGVTTAKIADANVTAEKLADVSVTFAKLADAVRARLGHSNYEEFVADGVTPFFDLANDDAVGSPASLQVELNGLVQRQGPGEDFVFQDNGGTGDVDRILFNTAPSAGDVVVVKYARMTE